MLHGVPIPAEILHWLSSVNLARITLHREHVIALNDTESSPQNIGNTSEALKACSRHRRRVYRDSVKMGYSVHFIIHWTIGLTGYIGPLTLTLYSQIVW